MPHSPEQSILLAACKEWDLKEVFLEPVTVVGLKNWHNYHCLCWPDRFTVILSLKVTFRRSPLLLLLGCLCTRLELQLVQQHRVLKRGALGVTSVGMVLGGIFSPFQHTVCYRTVLFPMGYSPASDGLIIDYLWVRKQDLEGELLEWGYQILLPLSLKLSPCLHYFPSICKYKRAATRNSQTKWKRNSIDMRQRVHNPALLYAEQGLPWAHSLARD